MPRKEKQYHYLYKTTNLINNKYYYGMHSTSKLEDGYLGSGLRLRRSIRKYGKENFKIEIIEFFNSREDLIDAEIKLITELVIKDDLCMNLKCGGQGGFTKEQSTKGALKMLSIIWNDSEYIKRHKINKSKLFTELNKIGKIKHCDWSGKQHTQESKDKIGNTNSIKQKGELNSQFGTCWIMNDTDSIKIKNSELDMYLSLGWIKGRKMIKKKKD